jgi:hypothetical protein
MDQFNKLQQLLDSAKEDFSKFYEKGNSSAGSRVRKHMQELKHIAQDIRIDVQTKKEAAKTPKA